MAATVLKGKTGVVSFGDFDALIFGVTLSTGPAMIPIPAFGDTWNSFTDGLRDLSGTGSAYLTKGDAGSNPFTETEGEEVAISIQYDTGCVVTFDGKIFGTTITFDSTGVGLVQFAFAKSNQDAPVVTWNIS